MTQPPKAAAACSCSLGWGGGVRSGEGRQRAAGEGGRELAGPWSWSGRLKVIYIFLNFVL